MCSFSIHSTNEIYIGDLLDNLNVMGFKPNVMLVKGIHIVFHLVLCFL